MVRTGWVAGWAIPVHHPPTSQPALLEEDPRSRQRSGPRKAQGPGVGGLRGPDVPVFGGGDGSWRPPFGPGRSPGPSLSPGPLKCRLWANKARFDDISWKLSQNRGVSPKYVEKASRSPYFQNEVQKSPLGFLGFPFPLAFSHKELMGLF